MGKQGFEKFIKKELTGSHKKEALRQEKRKFKKDEREAGEEYRRKLKEKRSGQVPNAADKKSPPSKRAIVKNDNKANKNFDKAEAAPPKTHKASLEKVKPAAKQPNITNPNVTEFEQMPLNKFIAHAGVCSRREAAEIVKQGKVTVNKDIVYEPGFKVSSSDKVVFKGKTLFPQHNLVYILLNKPKDFLTTAKDPEGRKTVFDIIGNATKERVYPVGRLDRNTTGVLLFTNDGELAQKLTHPSFQVKKIYEVKIDKPLMKKDYDAILNGITLEDGPVVADALAYADSKDKSIIGIEIHSGRNRIVRRLFEHLGYDVRNLDRVMFANLTKKNVDRGKWRFLTEKEVRLLKYMNQAFVKQKKDKDAATVQGWKNDELGEE